jgi:aryl-alcohol dehydrogenase-like predicted oxidoreductase
MEMQYTYLGRSGMKVSRLCLGTMNFGWHTDKTEAFKIMDAALDAGVNFFDTANSYGGDRDNRGLTEQIIGRWFAQGGARREKVVLATKVYSAMPDACDGPNEAAGLSAFKIRRHVDASLRRLQTDHIELYQMHHIDENVTWDELWDVYEALTLQGKIYYIGSSNFAGWHLSHAQAAAKARNFLGLISEQHKYNLVCRYPELEVLPAAKAMGIGIMVYSPLAGGALAGKEVKSVRRQGEIGQKTAERFSQQLAEYSELCKDLGKKEADVALAWLLSNPVVTSPVIGPRTLAQFEDCIRAVEISLNEESLTRLDEIFPGHGGAAPKAYAW